MDKKIKRRVIYAFLILFHIILMGLVVGLVSSQADAYNKPFQRIKLFCDEQTHGGNKFTLNCEVIYAQ